MAKLGIDMINMYVGLIQEEFQPLINQVQQLESSRKEQITEEVKKELGIYELWVQRAKLQLELKQLDSKIEEFTDMKWDDTRRTRQSKLSAAVDARMEREMNGVAAEVRGMRAEMIRKIKLTGLTGDTAGAFEELPGIIANLSAKVEKALPPPKSMKQAIAHKEKDDG